MNLGLTALPLAAQINVLAHALLHGVMESDTQQVLLSGSNPLAAKAGVERPQSARPPTLGELMGLAIA